MTDSSNAPPSQRLPAILAAVGVLLSLWLWFIHVQTYLWPSASSFCSPNAQFDCVQVAASRYSVFLGVPWAAYGVAGFGALLVLTLRRSLAALPFALGMSLASIVLLGIEVVAIGSVCLVCEAAHVAVWAATAALLRTRRGLVDDLKRPVTWQVAIVWPLSFLVTLAVFLPRYWGSMSYKAPPPFPTGVTEEGFAWIGSEKPRLTIHEYTDYLCPHCKVASSQTLQELARSGDVRIVRHQQPRMHCNVPRSCEPLRVALCAAEQGKFWQADRYLFEAGADRRELDIARVSRELDLDAKRLETCFEAEATWTEAERQAQEANRAKIRGTPGYIVDGKKLTHAEVMKLF